MSLTSHAFDSAAGSLLKQTRVAGGPEAQGAPLGLNRLMLLGDRVDAVQVDGVGVMSAGRLRRMVRQSRRVASSTIVNEIVVAVPVTGMLVVEVRMSEVEVYARAVSRVPQIDVRMAQHEGRLSQQHARQQQQRHDRANHNTHLGMATEPLIYSNYGDQS